MTPRSFKLALVQMEVRGGQKEWNVEHGIAQIKAAAENCADVVLLPECMDLGWTHPSSKSEAMTVPNGYAYEAMAQAARVFGVYICVGLTEKAGGRVYNTAVLIDKSGKLLCRHRKLNELEIGHEYYDQGNKLEVVETEFGAFGVMICADAFAKDQVLARSLGYMGADIILSPSAWALRYDHDNELDPYGDFWRNSYVPVAKEFSISIFGVSNVGAVSDGPWKGKKYIGCSLAISSDGTDILQGPYGINADCILYVDVLPLERPARGCGWQGA